MSHWFETKFPDDWAWAFTGESPAYRTMTQADLARELDRRTDTGLTAAAINHIVRHLGEESDREQAPAPETTAPVPPTTEETVEGRVTLAQQLLQIRSEQHYLKELEQQEVRRRVVLQALTDGAAVLPPPLAWSPPAPLDPSETPHLLLLQWSDLHAGKWVDPSKVGERFEYDRSVLEDAIAHWLRGIRRFLEIYRASFPINRIVVAALGDMVDGSTMRPVQRLRVDHLIGTIGRQTMYTGRLIAEVVRELGGLVEQLDFIGLGGNHGRVGKFGEDEYLDNFDWLAYHFAEAHLSTVKNIRFYIPDTPTAFVKLGEKTFFFQHGDAIRSWGESPAGAVKRAVRKDAFVQGVAPDYSLMGHFHQAISFQAGGSMRVYMNGHFDGGDAYCVNCLKEATEPTQNLFLVHPRRGIVAHHEILLREEQTAPATPFEFELIAA